MKVIEAFETTDKQIFINYSKAKEHQEAIQASLFLDFIILTIPERERNCLTSNDWFRAQVNVVKSVDKKQLVKLLNDLLDAFDFEPIEQE